MIRESFWSLWLRRLLILAFLPLFLLALLIVEDKAWLAFFVVVVLVIFAMLYV